MKVADCLFCKFVSGELPCHRVWEDEQHLAFLTIFPNTEGFTVVIPKDHHDSYVFAVEPSVMNDLMAAARTVAQAIDIAYSGDVGRTGLIFEGFGVNHLHAKLIPMHGTASDAWQQHNSDLADTYFEQYLGYLSSHNGKRADDTQLAQIAAKIRTAAKSLVQ